MYWAKVACILSTVPPPARPPLLAGGVLLELTYLSQCSLYSYSSTIIRRQTFSFLVCMCAWWYKPSFFVSDGWNQSYFCVINDSKPICSALEVPDTWWVLLLLVAPYFVYHCTFSFSVSLVLYLNLSLVIISIFPLAKIWPFRPDVIVYR